MQTKVARSRRERQSNTYGADRQPIILRAEVSSDSEVEILADADPSTMRASRLGRLVVVRPHARGLHERPSVDPWCWLASRPPRVVVKPDVTQPDDEASLEQLVADAGAAEERSADLEQTKKRTAAAKTRSGAAAL
jgi:hypothetical protein